MTIPAAIGKALPAILEEVSARDLVSGKYTVDASGSVHDRSGIRGMLHCRTNNQPSYSFPVADPATASIRTATAQRSAPLLLERACVRLFASLSKAHPDRGVTTVKNSLCLSAGRR
jgi:hypothetical protein